MSRYDDMKLLFPDNTNGEITPGDMRTMVGLLEQEKTDITRDYSTKAYANAQMQAAKDLSNANDATQNTLLAGLRTDVNDHKGHLNHGFQIWVGGQYHGSINDAIAGDFIPITFPSHFKTGEAYKVVFGTGKVWKAISDIVGAAVAETPFNGAAYLTVVPGTQTSDGFLITAKARISEHESRWYCPATVTKI